MNIMEKKTTMSVLEPLEDTSGELDERRLRYALYLCIKDNGMIKGTEWHKVFPPRLYYAFDRHIKLFLTDTYKRIHGDIEPIIPAICERVVSDWKIAGKNRMDDEKAAIESMETLKARYSPTPADQPQQIENSENRGMEIDLDNPIYGGLMSLLANKDNTDRLKQFIKEVKTSKELGGSDKSVAKKLGTIKQYQDLFDLSDRKQVCKAFIMARLITSTEGSFLNALSEYLKKKKAE